MESVFIPTVIGPIAADGEPARDLTYEQLWGEEEVPAADLGAAAGGAAGLGAEKDARPHDATAGDV